MVNDRRPLDGALLANPWLSPSQIAKLRLPGLPKSRRAVNKLAVLEEWALQAGGALARRRVGRGGGMEYHASLFNAYALDVLLNGRARQEVNGPIAAAFTIKVDGYLSADTQRALRDLLSDGARG